MNDVIRTITARRSCRAYSSAALEEEKLSAIIEAGRYAPSGGNNQTTHFIVIRDPEIRARLRAVAAEQFAAMEITEGMYKSLAGAIRRAKAGGYVYDYNAPTLVLTANKKGYGNAMADCSCALENMMIAATSLGIGSCWINQIHWLDENPAVRELLEKIGLGQDETVCGAVALGYRAESVGASEPLPRKGNPVTYI